MNCVQGDLAYAKYPVTEPTLINRMLIVDRAYDGGKAGGVQVRKEDFNRVGPCWVVRSAVAGETLPMVIGYYNQFGLIHKETVQKPEIALPDAWLRPIRDPGEDAKDEMLRPLPHQLEIT